MSLKPLGIVKEITDSVGIEVSYVYDDLVFVDHNAFFFQFTDKNNAVVLHVNKDADEQEIFRSIGLMNDAESLRDVVIMKGKYYTLVQADDEKVRLEFMDTRE
jgi:hypothetical protein